MPIIFSETRLFLLSFKKKLWEWLTPERDVVLALQSRLEHLNQVEEMSKSSHHEWLLDCPLELHFCWVWKFQFVFLMTKSIKMLKWTTIVWFTMQNSHRCASFQTTWFHATFKNREKKMLWTGAWTMSKNKFEMFYLIFDSLQHKILVSYQRETERNWSGRKTLICWIGKCLFCHRESQILLDFEFFINCPCC